MIWVDAGSGRAVPLAESLESLDEGHASSKAHNELDAFCGMPPSKPAIPIDRTPPEITFELWRYANHHSRIACLAGEDRVASKRGAEPTTADPDCCAGRRERLPSIDALDLFLV
jgi:hypothetical protein